MTIISQATNFLWKVLAPDEYSNIKKLSEPYLNSLTTTLPFKNCTVSFTEIESGGSLTVIQPHKSKSKKDISPSVKVMTEALQNQWIEPLTDDKQKSYDPLNRLDTAVLMIDDTIVIMNKTKNSSKLTANDGISDALKLCNGQPFRKSKHIWIYT